MKERDISFRKFKSEDKLLLFIASIFFSFSLFSLPLFFFKTVYKYARTNEEGWRLLQYLGAKCYKIYLSSFSAPYCTSVFYVNTCSYLFFYSFSQLFTTLQ